MKTSHIAALFAAVIVFGYVTNGRAQQPGDHGFQHPQHHDWYRGLRQPVTGYPCCNGSTPDVEGDCRPTQARKQGDRWWALVDGEWLPVPPNLVLPSSSSHEPYMAHVCANKARVIYCFIEKEGGT